MADEITIPLLPCHSIDAMLEFYRALGFEVTYQQSKPNNYAVVQRGSIELHFFSMRDYLPANSYCTCYVRTGDVDGLYQALTDGLRQTYGRVPSAGIPRVIPLKNKTGRREFIIVDPGGNWIRIGQVIEAVAEDEAPAGEKESATPLTRALQAAELLADSKGDDAAAAERLDKALAEADSAQPVQRVQALVMRAALAITLGDAATARQRLSEARAVALRDDERETLKSELGRADELEQMTP